MIFGSALTQQWVLMVRHNKPLRRAIILLRSIVRIGEKKSDIKSLFMRKCGYSEFRRSRDAVGVLRRVCLNFDQIGVKVFWRGPQP